MQNFLKDKIITNIKDKDFGEIFTGSIFTFIAKIVAVILGFIFNLIISRYYGASILGIFVLINTFFAITLIPSLLGINTSILRFIPEHIVKYSHYSALQLFKKAFIVVAIVSVIISVISFISSNIIAEYIFQKIYLAELFMLASFFIIFKALSGLNISVIRALKDVHLFAFFQIFNPILNITILLILTYIYFDQNNPIYTLFYSSIIVFALSLHLVNKLFNKQQSKQHTVENIKYKRFISTSFPMFLTSAMGVVITQTDIIMLGIYTTIQEVGIYAIVIKFALLTTFVLSSINTIVAPKFAELYYGNQLDILEKVVKKSSKMIFYSTLPIIIGLVIFGEFVLGLFGEEFVAGYTSLTILVFGQFINTSVGSVGYLMNMSGYQKEFNYIMMTSAIINILLNMILIPKYGISGAAIASVISLIFWNMVSVIFIKIKLNFYTGYLPIIGNKK